MSNEKTNAASGGIGFCGLLTIVFITLKLLGKIDWEWKWVLVLLWAPITLAIVVGGIWFLIYLIFFKRKNKSLNRLRRY